MSNTTTANTTSCHESVSTIVYRVPSTSSSSSSSSLSTTSSGTSPSTSNSCSSIAQAGYTKYTSFSTDSGSHKPSRNPREFDVIILATDTGNSLFPLCEGGPSHAKPMLTLANRPLLSFPFELLERTGFEEVLIVVTETIAPIASKAVSEFEGRFKLGYKIVSVGSGLQSAEIIAVLRKSNEITRDFIVVSADTLVDGGSSDILGRLIDQHRQLSAACTTLLYKPPPLDAATVKRRVKEESSGSASHIDYIGYDEDGRLLFFANATEVRKALSIRKSILKKYPNMLVTNTLLDCHCYVFSRWVADMLIDEHIIAKVKSLKTDLLPYLVRRQLYVDTLPDGAYKSPFESALSKTHTNISDKAKCFAYILQREDGRASRANTIQSYVDMNRDIAKLPKKLYPSYAPWEALGPRKFNYLSKSAQISKKTQVGDSCVIGDKTVVGDRCSVKRSVVGKNCKISNRVKLVSSVIMDNVVIQEGVVVQGSVICSNTVLGKQANVKDSIVSYDNQVPEKASLKKEIYSTSTIRQQRDGI
mmetsp:Transcript_21017/g.31262  ORF Transcript_21017/g.31262 Transcript_21017/m.31262 type:complete len:531 (-) Transcript_21017:45-1637(-)